MAARRKYPVPAVGSVYGRWTVLRVEYGERGGIVAIHCRCDCGAVDSPNLCNVFKGRSMGCDACAQRRCRQTRRDKLGYDAVIPDPDKRKRLLNRIYAIISRCTDPKSKNWANYGGRGITVHPEWRADIKVFLVYLATLPGYHCNAEIDRIDNERGYEPGNIRFASRAEQMRNRRCTVWIHYKGEQYTIGEFMAKHLPQYRAKTVVRRWIASGRPIEDLIGMRNRKEGVRYHKRRTAKSLSGGASDCG